MLIKFKNLATELMLLSVVIFWAANYTIGKYGVIVLSPSLFNVLRFLIAAPIMLIGTFIFEGSIKVDREDIGRLIIVGLVGIAFYQPLFMMTVKYTSATNASLLTAMSPIFTGIYAFITGQDKFTRRTQMGSLIALLGAATVIMSKNSLPVKYPHAFLGNMIGLVGSVLWGIYPVLANPLVKKYSSLRVTAWSGVIGVIVLTPLSISEISLLTNHLPKMTWVSLFYSIIFVTVYGLVAWYKGVGKIGSVNVMVYMYLIPLFAVIVAAILIKESVNLWQVMGGLVIITGMTIAKWPGKVDTEIVRA